MSFAQFFTTETVSPGASARSRAAPGDRRARARAVVWLSAGALFLAMGCSLFIGPSSVDLSSILGKLLYGGASENALLNARESLILFDIRLPRTLLGCLVGAGLAVSGAMMQGLFRNPLADPGLVGVSSGASLAAVMVIVLSSSVLAPVAGLLSYYTLPLAAFIGGLATTSGLYVISSRGGRTSVATMLLAGIALAAITGAVTGLLIFMSTDDQLRDFTFWSLGSLGGATWTSVLVCAPFVLVILLAIPLVAKALNALVLGEAEALHMGISVQRVKRLIILLVACATGATVAVSGAIGFVGLVAPHLLRLTIGPDHRYLLPAAACGGAVLILLADMAARIVVAPAELPIGIIMALIGGPVFISILLRQRSLLMM